MTHRDEPATKPLYDLIYAKRPAEELYDLKTDPDQMHNLATDPATGAVKADLSARLMSILEKTNDPRLTDAFDKPPYLVSTTAPEPKKRKGGKAGKTPQ